MDFRQLIFAEISDEPVYVEILHLIQPITRNKQKTRGLSNYFPPIYTKIGIPAELNYFFQLISGVFVVGVKRGCRHQDSGSLHGRSSE